MSLWLDELFLKQILYRLEGAKQIDTHQFIVRCPICGDSQKKKNKKRGYFYELKDSLHYHCFNCQVSVPFKKFLKDFDINLYKQYLLEKFKGVTPAPAKNVDDFIARQEKKIIDDKYKSFYTGLPTIRECGPGHIAFDTLKNRRIPDRYFDEFFYCDNFPKWTESFTGKYSTLSPHDRIIIPFWDNLGRPTYFQGRSFGKVEPRYFTYKILEDSDYKAFGLDKIDRHNIINVVEGPLDSTFLQNCVAVASSALHKFHVPGCKHRYIFDNEPRSKEICKLLHETIKNDKSVVIWPDEVKGIKDLNDMVIAGFDVNKLVSDNTFKGLEAVLAFNKWKKV